jgi:plastocyanin
MPASRLFAAAAALTLIFLAPAAVAQPSQLTVDVYSFGFGPRPIHLRAGQPVTLNFVNRSGSAHDFTARAFFAGSRKWGRIAAPARAAMSSAKSRAAARSIAVGTIVSS